MPRRRRPPEPEHLDRWIVSYADLITLLFALFVVMYATSSVNEGKMRVLSDSLTASFTGRNKALAPIQVGQLVRSPYTDDTSPITSPTPFIVAPRGALAPITPNKASPNREGNGEAATSENTSAQTSPDISDVETVSNVVQTQMQEWISAREVGLSVRPSWLEIELDSEKLFVSGRAEIAASAVPVLTRLADVLVQFSNPIQVEGFTDNVPIRTTAFPSNWELSAARAASVVHLFTRAGVLPERMVAIGYGEHRPVGDNRTARGRARNRRVVLVIPADDRARRLLNQNETFDLEEARVEIPAVD